MAVVERGKRFGVRVWNGAQQKHEWLGTFPTREAAEYAEQAVRQGRSSGNAAHQAAITRRVKNAARLAAHPPAPKDKGPRKSDVYMAYDADDNLLYIGFTSTAHRRFLRHAKDSAWWQDVARLQLEHFDNEADALARERELIQLYDPPHNTRHRRKATQITDAATAATDEALAERSGVSSPVEPAGGVISQAGETAPLGVVGASEGRETSADRPAFQASRAGKSALVTATRRLKSRLLTRKATSPRFP